MTPKELKGFLEQKVDEYNRPSFISKDPICIPHQFSKKQDIEIAGLFAALFAWGNRTTIINKSSELMMLMNNQPHEFCLNHSPSDLKKLLQFKHRTFNPTDILYFIEFLHQHYTKFESLEIAFSQWITKADTNIEKALIGFHTYFFSLPDSPERTKKHVATPLNKSTCKRLCMFLRWMVRKDSKGVDFGIWNSIGPNQLICPIDVHVARVAKMFGLIESSKLNWQTALELTNYLKTLDQKDPVKFDFALFSLGVLEH